MQISGTLSYADLYGPKTPAGDSTTTSPVEKSSGGLPAGPERGPGLTIVGILAMLAGIRILEEINPRVGGR
jgi:hypothetical protein